MFVPFQLWWGYSNISNISKTTPRRRPISIIRQVAIWECNVLGQLGLLEYNPENLCAIESHNHGTVLCSHFHVYHDHYLWSTLNIHPRRGIGYVLCLQIQTPVIPLSLSVNNITILLLYRLVTKTDFIHFFIILSFMSHDICPDAYLVANGKAMSPLLCDSEPCQTMACRLLGANPLPEPILTYCQPRLTYLSMGPLRINISKN